MEELRERIAVLEVEVEHLRSDIVNLRETNKELTKAVTDLTKLLNEARGGRRAIGYMLSAGGFLAGVFAGWSNLIETLGKLFKQ
jgi:prefoldin subunit 5